MWLPNISIAALFENGVLRLQLSFLDIRIHKQTTHWTSFYSDSNSEKEVYFGSEPARKRDLSTNAILS